MNRKVGAILAAFLVIIVPFAFCDGLDGTETIGQSKERGTIEVEVQREPDVTDLLSGIEPFFTENMGQVPEEGVLFHAMGEGISVTFTSQGVDYVVSRDGGRAEFQLHLGDGTSVTPFGQGPLGHRVNYLLGNDPSRWVRKAATFESVVYEGVYPGVDVRFHFLDDMLKYDVIVAPGTVLDDVVLEYSGMDGLSLDPATGDLLIHTAAGPVRDARPVFLQEGLGAGAPGAYRLLGEGRFGFHAPEGVVTDVPMVIDPGIEFSTLLVGSEYDEVLMVGVDPDGDIIVGGQTNSSDLPATPGANRTAQIGFFDGFCAKYDPTGSDLLFLTYFGGTLNEYIFDMEVYPDGTIWFGGLTYSRDFPTTEDAIFPDFLGGWCDGILLRLSNDGSDLLYATFLGGTVNENLRSVEYDAQGNIYVGGVTNSWDLPVTPGAFCMTRTDTSWMLSSGYVIKVNSSLTSIDYCTYINGLTYDSLYGMQWFEIGVGSTGRVYVAAATDDPGFPVTGGAFCTTKTAGYGDAVVFAFNPSGTDLDYSTFLGGDGEDMPFFINVGKDDRVYVTGFTNSTDYPVSNDAHRSTYSAFQDGFLTVLDSTLSTLEYGTYLGGSGQDVGASLAESPDGSCFFVFGGTTSFDLSTTSGCFDPHYRGVWPAPDTFLAAFDSSDNSLMYSSYLSGTGTDGASNKGILCDGSGSLYLVGATTSSDFPTTPGANMTVKGNSFDGYLLKIDPTACAMPSAPGGLRTETGDGFVNLTWDIHTGCDFRVLEHRIYRKTDGDLEPINVTTWPNHGWFRDDDVVNGVNYTYAVSTVNSVGESVLSDPVVGRPLARPDPPLDLVLRTGDGAVSLSWSAPGHTGGSLLGYHVLRGDASDNLTLLATIGRVASFVDEDLVLGRTYYYAVVAYNEAGNSSIEDVIQVVALDVPSRPTNFGSMVGDRMVDLYWDRPESDGGMGVLGYRLFRGPAVWDMTMLADLDRSQTTYRDSDLVNGRTYYYHVAAYSSVGEGDPTLPLEVIPRTLPGEPRSLSVEAGDGQVSLSWTPPLDDGGVPIIGYIVHFGEGSTVLTHSFEVGVITTHVHTGLTNGVRYYYAVSAVNEGGPGEVGGTESATPMGLPGKPVDFKVVSGLGEVELSWSAPADMGGATSLLYRVFRGTSSSDVSQTLADLTDEEEYVDDQVVVGDTYFYRVEAINVIGGSSTPALSVVVTTLPGQVRDMTADAGDGHVAIVWRPPGDDGASPLTGYVVLRGVPGGDLSEIARVGTVLQFNDTTVVNGEDYLYSVVALTAVGEGPALDPPLSAGPRGRPSRPGSVSADIGEDKVVLTWAEPTGEGMASVTGYRVYRRTASGEPELIATLGTVLTYTDKDVGPGKTYYYTIVADSDFGAGSMSSEYKAKVPSEEEGPPLTWLLLLLVLIIVIAVLGVAYTRSREAGEGPVDEGKAPYVVEEAFVVFQDGKLVTHLSRVPEEEADVSMMSGMLIAVQGIMQDGLEREGALESIKYGDNLIQIASGEHVNVVAVVYGTPDEELLEDLQAAVSNIEATYAGVIEEWLGDLTVLDGIDEMVEPLLDRTRELTREDVARAAVRPGVSLQSAVDFHRGFVRLKVAAVNTSEEAVMDTGVEIHYDRDLLRLDRVEPDVVTLRGDKAELGNLKAGERKALAFLFDPQICQETHLDGTMSYYDTKGDLKHVEMKRRHANVVCPIFFTKEHANTAMLRRLIKEKLHMSDSRIFTYPGSISGPEILEVGKLALGGIDIQLVREFINEGPPFGAEVWYYGETRVKGYQMVMRLGVLSDRGILEFFAASTDMEPITGLLAEFRRELQQAVQDKFPEVPVLEPEVEEEVRFEVVGRPLLLDEWEEYEGED